MYSDEFLIFYCIPFAKNIAFRFADYILLSILLLIGTNTVIAQVETETYAENNDVSDKDEDDDYILPKNFFLIGIDANVGTVLSDIELNKSLPIRHNSNYIYQDRTNFAFGVNAEYRILRRLGVVFGLQYYAAFLSAKYNDDFFYLQYAQEDNTIYYANTKKITELANFVGIPLAVKYVAHSRKHFGINLLLNVDTYFRVYSKYNIELASNNMLGREKEILNSLEKPSNHVLVNISPSVMLRFGNEHRVHGNLEIKLPILSVGSKSNFLLASNSEVSFLLRAVIVFPLKFNK